MELARLNTQQTTPIVALTLDLDDTLWPIGPTMQAAERAMKAWFEANAPRVLDLSIGEDVRAIRSSLIELYPERAHNLRWLRQETYSRALVRAGYPIELAVGAFQCFDTERQNVTLFEGTREALGALSRRYPIVAVSNGFADLQRIGIAGHFVGTIGASDFGVAKPHPDIFLAACRLLQTEPRSVLHIGDDRVTDVEGALNAGLQAAWINPTGVPWTGTVAPTLTCRTLAELAVLLGATM